MAIYSAALSRRRHRALRRQTVDRHRVARTSTPGRGRGGRKPERSDSLDNGNTHEDNINTLRANNVTLGCNPEGTLYCPNDSVRRDHMAAFIHRALG